MSELSKFLEYPQSKDWIPNPPTCSECNSIVEGTGRCRKCTLDRRKKLRDDLHADVEAVRHWILTGKKLADKKSPDAAYYWIVYAVSLLLSVGYICLIYFLWSTMK